MALLNGDYSRRTGAGRVLTGNTGLQNGQRHLTAGGRGGGNKDVNLPNAHQGRRETGILDILVRDIGSIAPTGISNQNLRAHRGRKYLRGVPIRWSIWNIALTSSVEANDLSFGNR